MRAQRRWTAFVLLLAVCASANFRGNVARAAAPPSICASPPSDIIATPTYQFGYRPAQIRRAYGFGSLSATGAGQTVAIVVPYGSATLESDLDIFNREFNLPPAKLEVSYPRGKAKEPKNSWVIETSLDVEWIHALAPDARLLLVVAESSTLEDLLDAVDYATAHGANVVSMSWGIPEFPAETRLDSHFKNPGVVYVAAAGDLSHAVFWPAASPYVVSVGGTVLPLDVKGDRLENESAWSRSSGGISAYEPEPVYQKQRHIHSDGNRVVPDVSFVASRLTGVAVYASTDGSTKGGGNSGWFVVGGTSLGATAWSALMALADQGREVPLTDGHQALYDAARGPKLMFRDVTTGTNGHCGDLSVAGEEFDAIMGLGTPVVSGLVPYLQEFEPRPRMRRRIS